MPTNALPRSLSLALGASEVDGFDDRPFDGTLAAAIACYAAERRRDGLGAATIRGMILYPGKAVLERVPDGIRLEGLGVDALCAFVRRALEDGYSSSTIREKHLGIVRTLCRRYGAEVHTTEVKRRMRSALAARYMPPPRLTEEDLQGIFHGIEHYPRHLRTRWRDLATIRLLALLAIRTHELCRVRIERDVHLGVPCIDIRESKCRQVPRRFRLTETLANDVRTLATCRSSGPLIVGGPSKVNTILERWKPRLKEPRLNQTHLRRSAASNLILQGAPLPTVRDVLGHVRNSAQTLRYCLTDEARMEVELTRLEHRTRPPRTPPSNGPNVPQPPSP